MRFYRTTAVGSAVWASRGVRAGVVIFTAVSALQRALPLIVTAVGRLLADLSGPLVVGIAVGGFAVSIVDHRHVGDAAGRAAVTASRPPAIRMRHTVNYRRAIADGVVTVKVGIIVGPTTVVVIAVTSGIVSPLWVACANEDGGGKRAAPVAVALAVRSADGTR